MSLGTDVLAMLFSAATSKRFPIKTEYKGYDIEIADTDKGLSLIVNNKTEDFYEDSNLKDKTVTLSTNVGGNNIKAVITQKNVEIFWDGRRILKK